MARTKNTLRREPPLGLPRATFKKEVSCPVCGLVVRSSNLARHRRVRHPAAGLPVSSSTPFASPATTPGRTVTSPLQLTMKVRLPAVDRAISERMEVEATVVEATTRDLPPTPTTEEDLQRELAKLYSGRVNKRASATSISYNFTRDLTAVAKNPDQREDLTEILWAAGLVLLSKEEWEKRTEKTPEKEPEVGTQEIQASQWQAMPDRLVLSFPFPPSAKAPASLFGIKVTPFRCD